LEWRGEEGWLRIWKGIKDSVTDSRECHLAGQTPAPPGAQSFIYSIFLLPEEELMKMKISAVT